jgi:hypothetical protein
MNPNESLCNLIQELAKIDCDRVLDPHAAKMCAEFNPVSDDPVKFLLSMEDRFVRYAWADGTIMSVVSAFLNGHPTARSETPVEKARRRREIEPGEETQQMLRDAKIAEKNSETA